MASLTEQLASIGILQEQASRPISRAPRSRWPDKIHLLANWAIQDKDKIYISDDIEQKEEGSNGVRVDFGKSDMYPWPLRDLNLLDFVQIQPTYRYGNYDELLKKNMVYETYCYALEIVMDRVNTSSGAFKGYQGLGSFTMAYNNRVDNTGEYYVNPTSSISNFFPTLQIKVENNDVKTVKKSRVYIEGSLMWVENTEDLELVIKIGNVDNKNVLFPVYSYTYKDVTTFISKEDLFKQLSSSQNVNLSSFKQSLAIKDVQMIEIESASQDKTPREEFINKYAFDYNPIMEEMKLTPDNSRPPSGEYQVTGTQMIRALATTQNGKRATTTAQSISYIQPVKLNYKLHVNLSNNIQLNRLYDTAGNIIVKVTGSPYLVFSEQGIPSNGFANADIKWDYKEQVVFDDTTQFVKAFDYKGSMVNTSLANRSFKDSLVPELEDLKINLKLKFDSFINQLRQQGRGLSVIDFNPNDLEYLSSLPKSLDLSSTNLTSEVDKYITETLRYITSYINGFSIVFAYALFSQQSFINNVVMKDYGISEYLFCRGIDSESLRRNLEAINLVTNEDDQLGKFVRFIRNNVSHKLPGALFGKNTPEGDRIKAWNFNNLNINNSARVGISVS